MDVQADEASVGSDSPPTVAAGVPARRVLGAPHSVHQGTFFQDDPYPTFADTDRTPAVQPPAAAPERRPPSASRGLRFAVVVAALAVAAAATTLGLVEAGVIHTKNRTGPQTSAPPPATHAHPSASNAHHPAASKQTLLTAAGFGPTNAAYTVNARAFGLTITTTTGRAWVSVGIVGQKPIYAGIVNADSSQHVTILGPAQLQIGAGGTSVTITSNRRSQTLTPPVAPFTYQFTPS